MTDTVMMIPLRYNRSVSYFTDAENTLEPESLDGMTWNKVKKVITKALNDYYIKRNKN